MASVNEERDEVARALKKLDEWSSRFERLVGERDTPALSAALDGLNKGDLQRILFACVLLEQRRRSERSGTERTPFGHDPNDH
jgi:hypothetical protein